MSDRLDEIRQRAEAATPGPWRDGHTLRLQLGTEWLKADIHCPFTGKADWNQTPWPQRPACRRVVIDGGDQPDLEADATECQVQLYWDNIDHMCCWVDDEGIDHFEPDQYPIPVEYWWVEFDLQVRGLRAEETDHG